MRPGFVRGGAHGDVDGGMPVTRCLTFIIAERGSWPDARGRRPVRKRTGVGITAS